jgi:hypothetical protein
MNDLAGRRLPPLACACTDLLVIVLAASTAVDRPPAGGLGTGAIVGSVLGSPGRPRRDRGAADATWYNAERRLLYVAIGNPGVVDVIDTVAMTRSEQVTTEAGAKTTAFDPVRQQLAVFLPSACRVALYREL